MSWLASIQLALLPVMAASAIQAHRMRVTGKGRITVAMRKPLLREGLRKIQNGDQRGYYFLFAAQDIRTWQIGVFFLIQIPTWIMLIVGTIPVTVSTLSFVLTYEVPYIGLHVDDMLTGIDKDKWKRRAKALKNRFKWAWTPAPVPVRVSA